MMSAAPDLAPDLRQALRIAVRIASGTMTQRNVRKMSGEFERLRQPGEQLFDVTLVHKAPKAPVGSRSGRSGDDRLIGEVIDDYLAAVTNFSGWLFLTDRRLACSGHTSKGLARTEPRSWEVKREEVTGIKLQRRTRNPLGDRFWPFTITFSDGSSLWLRSTRSEIKALIAIFSQPSPPTQHP